MPVALIVAAILHALSVQQAARGQAAVTNRQTTLMGEERERRKRMREEELKRQDEFAKQARERNAEALEQFTVGNQNERVAAIQNTAEASLAPTSTPNAGDYPAGLNAPTEVADSIAQAVEQATQRGRTHARNTAQLRGFGDLAFENDLATGNLQRGVNSLSRSSGRSNQLFRTGLDESGRVYEQDMRVATGRAMPYNRASDALGTAANIASIYGMFGGGGTAPTRPRPFSIYSGGGHYGLG